MAEEKLKQCTYLTSVTPAQRFIGLCQGINREGIDRLLEWLEKSDFYTAPASTRFHGNYPGGLLEHSLNVYYEMGFSNGDKDVGKAYEQYPLAWALHVADEAASYILEKKE